jgi:hypothetical protein
MGFIKIRLYPNSVGNYVQCTQNYVIIHINYCFVLYKEGGDPGENASRDVSFRQWSASLEATIRRILGALLYKNEERCPSGRMMLGSSA